MVLVPIAQCAASRCVPNINLRKSSVPRWGWSYLQTGKGTRLVCWKRNEAYKYRVRNTVNLRVHFTRTISCSTAGYLLRLEPFDYPSCDTAAVQNRFASSCVRISTEARCANQDDELVKIGGYLHPHFLSPLVRKQAWGSCFHISQPSQGQTDSCRLHKPHVECSQREAQPSGRSGISADSSYPLRNNTALARI